MKLQDKFLELRKHNKALLATNFYNFETLKGIMLAVQSSNLPIILQLTQSSINYMGLENAFSMAKTALKYYGIEGWIHLDHGNSIELVKKCLEIGFDSVMFDGSELSFEQNISLTKEVVAIAEKYNANVEAELGYVAKLGQSTDKIGFTEPDDAKVFVEQTGVDALAIAIGTAHGFYTEKPKLDFNRLKIINKIVDTALVLHGGSGVPHKDVKKAISLGINKVNIATEIKNIFMKTLKKIMTNNDEIDLRKVFPFATKEVEKLIKHKLDILD